MPFKSKKQHRYFRYLESQGKLPQGTSDKWVKHTDNMKNLPESVKEAARSRIVNSRTTAAFNPISIQKQELDAINTDKMKGMTPVQYRNSRKNTL